MALFIAGAVFGVALASCAFCAYMVDNYIKQLYREAMAARVVAAALREEVQELKTRTYFVASDTPTKLSYRVPTQSLIPSSL